MKQPHSITSPEEMGNYRSKFTIPQHKGKDVLYFAGNSLGLQPKGTKSFVLSELQKWEELGVEGHFTGDLPWANYHEVLSAPLARLVGALPSEVVAMNTLTTNLHLLLSTFLSPDKQRNSVLIESNVFSSDYFAITSQLDTLGYSTDNVLEIHPESSGLIDEGRLLETIRTHRDQICLVFLGGVNYLSGQVLPLREIAQECAAHNIHFGIDLAHGIGNVPLDLHEWGVDFAVWCSYKYLNAGPGAVGGLFIHEKHHQRQNQLKGWWGTQLKRRFEMQKTFEPMGTAETWQLSNAPILSMSSLRSSLSIFEEVDLPQLFARSRALTLGLHDMLKRLPALDIITSIEPGKHGAQLSVIYQGENEKMEEELRGKGVIFDTRKTGDHWLMRFAPVPLYNTFDDLDGLQEHLKATI